MREHFHVPKRYFLSHSVGCQPRRTSDRLSADYLDEWARLGGDAWPGWMDQLEQFRTGLGKLLGAEASSICPQANVSSALTKIIYSLEKPAKRRTILCTEEDFPTIGFVLKQAERSGFALRFVEGDVTDPAAWANAIDESVAFVHVTHAYSNTSRLSPVADICRLAKTAGATSIIDIAQSVGIVPIDLSKWGADFVIGTGVKFLCFGPGACFLHAATHIIDGTRPVDVGWFSHENPFEMDIHHFQYASDSMRFFGGTPSPAPLIAANAALEIWNTIGLAEVRDHAQGVIDAVVAKIPESWLVSPRDRQHRGGTIVINPPERARFRDALSQTAIRCDERKEGFRFSVHGYTSAQDIEALVSALASAQ